MPRLAILNMLIGFAVLAIAAMAGAFIATDMTTAYLKDKELLDAWSLMLQRSSHGHTNLFGLLHVSFGLTLPYSLLSPRVKLLQTLGLALGTFAMGPLMIVRGMTPPSESYDAVALAIGAGLSCALAALVLHAVGLAMKLMRRG